MGEFAVVKNRRRKGNMNLISNLIKITGTLLAFLLVLIQPRDAQAFGIDFLGELAKPIISPAQEKLKSLIVYIWLQPYVGYGTGSSDQSRTSAGGTITKRSGLSGNGFLYGGRGGILLAQSLRVGVDYTAHSIKRNTLVENNAGNFSEQGVSGRNTMFGAIVGFDVPFTPVQGYVTKYFKATMNGDSATDGDGWGGGISFVIKNPFILSLETRKLSYSSASDPTGKKASSTFSQYYLSLSFMLL